MKQVLVALVISQLSVGCVASNNDFDTLRAELSSNRESTEIQQQKINQRMAAVESQLKKVEKGNALAVPENSRIQQQNITQRMAGIESQLKKVEKGSALAVQMGLVSTVHSEKNQEGIASIRAEIDKLVSDINALQTRLAQSDQELESGLTQLRDLSLKLK